MSRPPVLITLLWAGMFIGGIVSAINMNWELLLACSLTFGLSLLPYAFESWSGIHSPPSFLAVISMFIFGSIFLGEARGFYERYWWWDLMLHTCSAIIFGMIGFVIILMMTRADWLRTSHVLVSFFAFSFAVSIGTIWELVEFLADQVFATNMQKSGLADTMTDMLVNVLGASIGSLSGLAYLKGAKGKFTHFIRGFVERNRTFFEKRKP